MTVSEMPQARKPVRPNKTRTSATPTPVTPSAQEPILDAGETLAQLLVASGAITERQLTHAKRVRAKVTGERTLMSVLEELGQVSLETLRETLKSHRNAVGLGPLLVELGDLRPAELDAARAIESEAKDGRKLAQILVDEHFVEDHRVAEVLSYQLGCRHVEASVAEIDRELLSRAAFSIYKVHAFLPLAREGERVVVTFADPLDSRHITAAQRVFGRDLIGAVTTKRALEEALEQLGQAAQPRRPASAADESTAAGMFNAIMDAALSQRASDIHIEPTKSSLRVRFRRDGILAVFKDYPMEMAPLLASRIKVLANADIAEKRRHQDGRILYQVPETGIQVDLRVSIYATIFGEKIVVRLLNKTQQLVELANIGMAPRMLERFRYDALDLPSGVLIITGPTGSGKTTTLYSGVNYLNDIHTSIITAEDPVEYVIDGVGQCTINPKIDVTYEETLRHIVRQDPDIIVLGEIRDKFSADTAIQAALTGHKVLTTFHTEDSIGGLLRLMNMNVEAFLISSTVVCVVAQRLLRKVCTHCAEPYEVTPRDLQRIGWSPAELPTCRFVLGRGCDSCRFTGYDGRIGVFELLVLDERVKDAILQQQTSAQIRRTSVESSGLVTLLEDGVLKAANARTSIPEVVRTLPRIQRARPVDELRRLLGES